MGRGPYDRLRLYKLRAVGGSMYPSGHDNGGVAIILNSIGAIQLSTIRNSVLFFYWKFNFLDLGPALLIICV